MNLLKTLSNFVTSIVSKLNPTVRVVSNDGYWIEYSNGQRDGIVLIECFKRYPEDVVAAALGCSLGYSLNRDYVPCREEIDRARTVPFKPCGDLSQDTMRTRAILGHGGTQAECCARFMAILMCGKHPEGYLINAPKDVAEMHQKFVKREIGFSEMANWLYQYSVDYLSRNPQTAAAAPPPSIPVPANHCGNPEVSCTG